MMGLLGTQNKLSSHMLFTRSTYTPLTKHPFYGSRYTTFLLAIPHLISMLSIGTLFQTNTKITFEALESLEASLQRYDYTFSISIFCPFFK